MRGGGRHASHRQLRRRVRRSLCYGATGRRIDQLPLPLSELAVQYFDNNSPYDYLDLDFATTLSRESCVDPCALVVAFVYLDRLRCANRQHFEASDPANLYLASLMLATKYLQDEGDAAFVYNDEWAASAQTTTARVNALELDTLAALDWRLLVAAHDFDRRLAELEAAVAANQLRRRRFATYADLAALSRHCLSWRLLRDQLLCPLLAAVGVASIAYLAAVVGAFTVAAHCAAKPTSAPLAARSIDQHIHQAELENDHGAGASVPNDLRQLKALSGESAPCRCRWRPVLSNSSSDSSGVTLNLSNNCADLAFVSLSTRTLMMPLISFG